ncbi:15062_t:CDS:1, partial [Acaulospora colombiana]
MLVCQYANNGNLYQYLEKHFDILTWGDKKSIILEIAYGIKAIHDEDLIHSNLHPGNILRHVNRKTGDQHTYISDLGICNPVDERHTSKVYGVLPFVAPEVLQGSKCTKSSDIYSLAMLMWTIITGRKLYSDRPHDVYLILEICSELRPEIPRSTPHTLVDLIMKCWDSDPTKRPGIREVIFMLNWIPFSEGGPIELSTDPFPQHQNAIYASHLLYSHDTEERLRKLKEEGSRKLKEEIRKEDLEGFVEIINDLDVFVE